MPDQPSRGQTAVKNGRFVLGAGLAAKICAVEGLTLSSRMRALLAQTSMHRLTSEERRTLVLAQLRQRDMDV